MRSGHVSHVCDPDIVFAYLPAAQPTHNVLPRVFFTVPVPQMLQLSNGSAVGCGISTPARMDMWSCQVCTTNLIYLVVISAPKTCSLVSSPSYSILSIVEIVVNVLPSVECFRIISDTH